MDLGLQRKVALILGASKGIGKACAAALAAEGATIVIGARNKEPLEQTAQEIRQINHVPVLAVATDVTRTEDIQTLVDAAIKQFGHIDILVNNAGGPPSGSFETITDSAWQRAFELNLLSNVRLIRQVLPHMQNIQNGRIINIISTSVKQPLDGLLLSNALRTGVVGMAKTLSVELAPYGITVNNVCPGRILTERTYEIYHVREKMSAGMSEEEALQTVAEPIPLKRLGKTEEIGDLVTFLASERANYITGTTIQVDGGLTRALM